MDRLFLVWPLTIEHYIDEESPFWNISADDLKKGAFNHSIAELEKLWNSIDFFFISNPRTI